MEHQRLPHDPAYKQFFSNPEMVKSLLRDFVPADFVKDLDFSTLERCAGSYVTDDLRERHDDIVWRVGWKKGSWCYVALLIEFQSTPDHWMALRLLSYTALLLLDLVKSGKIHEGEGLPPVFPIVIYHGSRAWNAPQEVAELFAPMPDGLKLYCPRHRHFLLDESSVPGETLARNKGLVAQLLRLERAQTPEQIQELCKELIEQLRDPEYRSLRRAFSVWLGRVVLQRSGITEDIPEFQDLREVDAMLEERAAQWKQEYIRQGVLLGKAEGISIGEARGEARGVKIGEERGVRIGEARGVRIGEARGVRIGEARGVRIGEARGVLIGEAKGFRQALLDVLELRFGTLPLPLTAAIATFTDAGTLRTLTIAAYHAESLQAFMEHLNSCKPQ